MALGIVDAVRSFFNVFRGRKGLWTTPRLGVSVAIAAGVVMEDAWLDEKAEAKQNAARQYWSARNLMMGRLLEFLSECIILFPNGLLGCILRPEMIWMLIQEFMD